MILNLMPCVFPVLFIKGLPWWKLPATSQSRVVPTGWCTPWAFWSLSGPWLPCCWASRLGDAS